MTHTVAKILMRIIGTLVGMFGVFMLSFGLFLVYESFTEQNPLIIGHTVFIMGLAVYFLFVAYLVWFRFSPLAVRHIFGILGLYVLSLLPSFVHPALDPHRYWMLFAYLGSLVVVYFAYRFASDRVSRLLFPEDISGVQS